MRLAVSAGDPLRGSGLLANHERGVDWHTRKVLAWRISNTLEAAFCRSRQIWPCQIVCRAAEQGRQFTSFAWTDRLRRSGVVKWLTKDDTKPDQQEQKVA